MPTIKQEKLAKTYLEELKSDKPRSKGVIMRESGYADNTAIKPIQVFASKGFQEILSEVDDNRIIKKWNKWALQEKDRRTSLEAGKEIMKLKGRYPKEQTEIEAGEIKVTIKKE